MLGGLTPTLMGRLVIKDSNMGNVVDKWLRTITIVCFLISICLFGLLFFGYGNLRIVVPSNFRVQVNGHDVNDSKLKLRFGSYNISALSPSYKLDNQKVRVPLFGTAVYKPSFEPRDAGSILTSTIVVDGAFGKPELTNIKWFDNNLWIAGQLILSGNFIALHYQNNSWRVMYYQAGGDYSNDISQLPQNIAKYINTEKARYGSRQH